MKIAIVGGGFCGTVLAARLLKENKGIPMEIILIEKNPPKVKGAAYSTEKDFHLLNVKADNMSAFPEDTSHFLKWLHKNHIPLSASTHMPRKLYGRYLNDVLIEAKAETHSAFSQLTDEVVDIEMIANQATLLLKSGEFIEADKVVLSLGNFSPAPLAFPIPAETYCDNPWQSTAIDTIPKNSSILIIGTGLTMVDVCMSLYENNHIGKIISISNHGYVPATHEYSAPYPDFYDDLRDKHTALEIFKTVRKHLKKAKEEGYNWRRVLDALRPYTNLLWNQLSVTEKNVFLKKLNRIWNVSRHRIPPEYNDRLNQLLQTHQLQLLKGRVLSAEWINDAIKVRYKPRGEDWTKELSVDYIINCTGPQQNYSRINHPFIKNLLTKKLIESGISGMGINTNEQGAIVAEGKASDILYTVGPPRIGTLFETTAVPELRVQVKALAQLLSTIQTDRRNVLSPAF